MRLRRKVRVGSRLTRVYEQAQTPLDRLLMQGGGAPVKVAALRRLRARLDPFALAEAIERKLACVYRLAHRRPSGTATRTEEAALQDLQRRFGVVLRLGVAPARLKRQHRSVTSPVAR